MKRIIIDENQRGLLFSNGRFVKVLSAGKYYTYGGRAIELVSTEEPLESLRCPMEQLLKNSYIRDNTVTAEVKNGEVALHYVNGEFRDALTVGSHTYWTVNDKHEFRVIDTAEPEVGGDVPAYIFSQIPDSLYRRLEVADHQKARLYYDNRFVRLLDAGTYYFWSGSTKVSAALVDTRRRAMEVNGQSVLTKDKVELRITFMLSYKITDYIKIGSEIEDFEKQLYTAAQLTLRELAGRYKVDEILENREQLSADAAEILREKAAALYTDIVDAGIRDIILPGEISSIMNTVLAAEKRAQANVITRREEVASTRSLLNTAKLMDENKTLYKLKELEYIERICENVGSISVESGRGLLSQLTAILADN